MSGRHLPENATKYAETAIFTEESVPKKLLGNHDTKSGVWGRIVVLKGELDYIIPKAEDEIFRLSPDKVGIILPTEIHRVSPIGSVRFKVEFFRVPD